MKKTTYGSETWSVAAKYEKRLQKIQRAMERTVLGISRRQQVRNEEIRRKLQLKDVIIKVRMKKAWTNISHI